MPSQQPIPDLLIAGASARAAAFSAFRGGLAVATADQFADRDLFLVAQTTEIRDWPGGVLPWAKSFPQSIPLMYAGGLENEPDLVDMIGRQRNVFGVVGDVLRRIRNPKFLRQLFAERGLAFAESFEAAESNASKDQVNSSAPSVLNVNAETTRWLVKRRKSGGGRGIRWWDGAPLLPGEYLQRFYEGLACSAAYLAHAHGCEVLGVARALMPSEDCRDRFRYLGSVTADFDAEDERQIHAIGDCLAGIGVRGLFGVDFIRCGGEAGEFTVLEVNPRYTASMEVHELRAGWSFVAAHRELFDSASKCRRARAGRGEHYGKRIVYAPRDVRVGKISLPSLSHIEAGDYRIADIPTAGSVHPNGSPICTVISRGTSSEACEAALWELEVEVLAGCEAV